MSNMINLDCISVMNYIMSIPDDERSIYMDNILRLCVDQVYKKKTHHNTIHDKTKLDTESDRKDTNNTFDSSSQYPTTSTNNEGTIN